MHSFTIPNARPAVDHSVGRMRRLRKHAGAALEYLWELAASLRLARADREAALRAQVEVELRDAADDIETRRTQHSKLRRVITRGIERVADEP